MILALFVGVASFVFGAGAATAAAYVHLRGRRTVSPEVEVLSDSDRDEVARDFAVHVSAVRRKVSEFADALADGDAQLRDRLRHFEQGGGQP